MDACGRGLVLYYACSSACMEASLRMTGTCAVAVQCSAVHARRPRRTRRRKGSLGMSSSVLFWYFRISCRALVPDLTLLLVTPACSALRFLLLSASTYGTDRTDG